MSVKKLPKQTLIHFFILSKDSVTVEKNNFHLILKTSQGRTSLLQHILPIPWP